MTEYIGQHFGNYHLISLLGRGGFADTYLGVHTYLNTFAAIKILQSPLGQRELDAFYNEACIIAKLKHHNIIRLLEFGVEKDIPYLVMDYAPHGTLRQFYTKEVMHAPATIIPYVTQIAAALQYAHDHKLVHRDVKPENLLLGPQNEVLLSDFGIAVIAQTQGQNMENIAGTVTYMAPEQIQGKPRPASDQYGLAVVIYEWLCGTVPFTGTYIEVALQHERAAPLALRKQVATIPADVEEVVLTALSKDPQQRFSNINAFAHALEQACTAHPFNYKRRAILPDPPPDSQVCVPTTAPTTDLVRYRSKTYKRPARQIHIFPSLQLPPDKNAHELLSISLQHNHIHALSQSRTSSKDDDGEQATEELEASVPSAQLVSATPSLAINAQHFTGAMQPAPKMRKYSTATMALLLLMIIFLVGGSALISISLYRALPFGLLAATTASTKMNEVVQVYTTSNTLAQANATGLAHSQATTTALATQTALQDIYTDATSQLPTLADTLGGADSYDWQEAAGQDDGCSFKDAAYHATAAANYFASCIASETNFHNFALQIEITILKGHVGGVIFRANHDGGQFYQFRIDTDGSYILNKYSLDQQGNNTLAPLLSGSSTLIHTGNRPNLIAVVANKADLYLYVNKHYIDSTNDSSFTFGAIGVYAAGDRNTAVDVMFRKLQIWKL